MRGTTIRLLLWFATTSQLFFSTSTFAWIPQSPGIGNRGIHTGVHARTGRVASSCRHGTSLRVVTNPFMDSTNRNAENWKEEGERIILEAAVETGAKPEQVAIEWKAGRIVVTFSGTAYMDADGANDSEDDLAVEDEFGGAELDSDEVEGFEEALAQGTSIEEREDDAVNVISIARAINRAFDEEGEGSIGFNIAVHHEIEVTTPGTDGEIIGDLMFTAYRGFDVICVTVDPKSKKKKTLEGKLIERNDDMTTVNIKGRVRKFKNYLLESVKLPKAKREKGAR